MGSKDKTLREKHFVWKKMRYDLLGHIIAETNQIQIKERARLLEEEMNILTNEKIKMKNLISHFKT